MMVQIDSRYPINMTVSAPAIGKHFAASRAKMNMSHWSIMSDQMPYRVKYTCSVILLSISQCAMNDT